MQRAQFAPCRSAAVQYSPCCQPPVLLSRRAVRACKATQDSSHSHNGCQHGKADPSVNNRPGSEGAGLPLLGPSASSAASTSSSSSSNSAPATPQPPAASSSGTGQSAETSKGVSAVQNFPPKRPQQQRRQLDVARAVQLLKLTTWRSDNKSTTKLPPYMMRTRDSESPNPAASTSSIASNGSSRGKPLAAIDTLDDIAADDFGASDADSSNSSGSSRGGAMGSRWRSSSPASSSSGSTQAAQSRLMYSASDPVRRPPSRSRQKTSEWALLPWQVLSCVRVCGTDGGGWHDEGSCLQAFSSIRGPRSW